MGAGQFALNQVSQSGERGRGLALAALCVGYAIGIWWLFIALSILPLLVQILTR